MKSLRSGWKAFERGLKPAREKMLLLDFDGTLVPIEKTPEAVRLQPGTRRVLEKITRMRSFRLVIVSGRSLADLKKYFRGFTRVFLVGNHGLEALPSASGLSKNARRARRASNTINVLATKLSMLFEGWPGVRVENKKYTLSLHFRNVPSDRKELFRQVVDFYRRKFGRKPLVWNLGKQVWEIRPAGYWGKADVAAHFMKKFPKAYPLAIGDDSADEEMFKTISKRGATIRVGRASRSSAGYFVRSPRELRTFLEELCRI